MFTQRFVFYSVAQGEVSDGVHETFLISDVNAPNNFPKDPPIVHDDNETVVEEKRRGNGLQRQRTATQHPRLGQSRGNIRFGNLYADNISQNRSLKARLIVRPMTRSNYSSKLNEDEVTKWRNKPSLAVGLSGIRGAPGQLYPRHDENGRFGGKQQDPSIVIHSAVFRILRDIREDWPDATALNLSNDNVPVGMRFRMTQQELFWMDISERWCKTVYHSGFLK
ncbi:hypothetical protein WN51_13657 [Melipona quadrifasciata]|uniref:Uncharacterized protein n=1 Tax=Melipona quadrifasciata TaxID=166423 RepID=A0A0M8ZYB1_9HYME|nr:hypothetical protein WN51_13657 [Melipona quadrifasciata]